MSLKLALVVAAARNNVIGKNNQLPWHLPQDLKHFKALTIGKPVIMGRKTYESIGKPLPGRTNIIITRQPYWAAEGTLTANDLSSAIALAQEAGQRLITKPQEIMIIGGAEIYRVSLPLADRVYLTRIDLDMQGDAHFPELSEREWRVISRVPGESGALTPYEFQIIDRIDH